MGVIKNSSLAMRTWGEEGEWGRKRDSDKFRTLRQKMKRSDKMERLNGRE